MPEIKYDYASVPTIREFARSNARLRGLMGPFGSGKSSGCVIELIRRGLAQIPGQDGIRRSRWAVIRNTYRQLEDTTIKTVLQWLPPNYFGRWLSSAHEYKLTRFKDCEIEILFRALDRPDHVSNLLSLELTGAWVNEAREVPWAIISGLMGRIDRYPTLQNGGATYAGVWMDTNPPDDESWWYQLFEEHLKPGTDQPSEFDAILFKQPSGLSPEAENLPNLKGDYYLNLSKLYDTEHAKIYVHGQYGMIQDGKPVYADYNDTLHCQPCSPVKGKVIYRGWDFGLTPACVFTQVSATGRWMIFDEMWSEDSGIDRFGDAVIEACRQKYAGYEFEDYGDPVGDTRAQTDEKTCFQILRGKGIKIMPGTQDLTSRIESVSKPLRTLIQGKPQLVIDPGCKMLRKGFQGRYEYKKIKTADNRYHETPDKSDYSHPHDALQYVATKLFLDKVKARKKATGQRQPDIKVT